MPFLPQALPASTLDGRRPLDGQRRAMDLNSLHGALPPRFRNLCPSDLDDGDNYTV